MYTLLDNPNPHQRQYRNPRRETPSGVVVVHTAENWPDDDGIDGGAEAVAAWLSRRTDAGSYHRLCDSDSIVACVPWWYEAWHDGTGSNRHSVGISAATRADQWPWMSPAWRDGCVFNMALAAADYANWLEAEHGIVIPARRISRAESEARVPGFISHAERDPGRRSDPGDAFPWEQFLGTYAWLRAGAPHTPDPVPLPPPTDYGAFDMATAQTKLVPVGPLGSSGEGWNEVFFDAPFTKIISATANGPHPPSDGYWPLPKTVSAQTRGDRAIVTVTDGWPGSIVNVWLTVA